MAFNPKSQDYITGLVQQSMTAPKPVYDKRASDYYKSIPDAYKFDSKTGYYINTYTNQKAPTTLPKLDPSRGAYPKASKTLYGSNPGAYYSALGNLQMWQNTIKKKPGYNYVPYDGGTRDYLNKLAKVLADQKKVFDTYQQYLSRNKTAPTTAGQIGQGLKAMTPTPAKVGSAISGAASKIGQTATNVAGKVINSPVGQAIQLGSDLGAFDQQKKQLTDAIDTFTRPTNAILAGAKTGLEGNITQIPKSVIEGLLRKGDNAYVKGTDVLSAAGMKDSGLRSALGVGLELVSDPFFAGTAAVKGAKLLGKGFTAAKSAASSAQQATRNFANNLAGTPNLALAGGSADNVASLIDDLARNATPNTTVRATAGAGGSKPHVDNNSSFNTAASNIQEAVKKGRTASVEDITKGVDAKDIPKVLTYLKEQNLINIIPANKTTNKVTVQILVDEKTLAQKLGAVETPKGATSGTQQAVSNDDALEKFYQQALEMKAGSKNNRFPTVKQLEKQGVPTPVAEAIVQRNKDLKKGSSTVPTAAQPAEVASPEETVQNRLQEFIKKQTPENVDSLLAAIRNLNLKPGATPTNVDDLVSAINKANSKQGTIPINPSGVGDVSGTQSLVPFQNPPEINEEALFELFRKMNLAQGTKIVTPDGVVYNPSAITNKSIVPVQNIFNKGVNVGEDGVPTSAGTRAGAVSKYNPSQQPAVQRVDKDGNILGETNPFIVTRSANSNPVNNLPNQQVNPMNLAEDVIRMDGKPPQVDINIDPNKNVRYVGGQRVELEPPTTQPPTTQSQAIVPYRGGVPATVSSAQNSTGKKSLFDTFKNMSNTKKLALLLGGSAALTSAGTFGTLKYMDSKNQPTTPAEQASEQKVTKAAEKAISNLGQTNQDDPQKIKDALLDAAFQYDLSQQEANDLLEMLVDPSSFSNPQFVMPELIGGDIMTPEQRAAYSKLFQPVTTDEELMKTLAQQVSSEYGNIMSGYNSQIEGLKSLQQADQNRLMQNQQRAEGRLDDNMFQKYMQTQENMNARGLLSSGLMSDAMRRLDVTRQDAIADLSGQTQEEIGQANRYYMPQINQIMADRRSVSQDAMLRNATNMAQQERTSQAQLASNYYNQMQQEIDRQNNFALEMAKLDYQQGVANAGSAREAANDYNKTLQEMAKSKTGEAGKASATAQVKQLNLRAKEIQDRINSITKQISEGSVDSTQGTEAINQLEKELSGYQNAADAVAIRGIPLDANGLKDYINFDASATTQTLGAAPSLADVAKNKFATTDVPYLQSVINDPYYVNMLTMADKGSLTNLEAAKRLQKAKVPIQVTNDILQKYKDVSKGGWGVSIAEKQAAKAFLDFYSKNRNSFRLVN